MIRWAEVQEVEKTSASSGEAELAEDDATDATCGEGKLTAVGRPLRVRAHKLVAHAVQ